MIYVLVLEILLQNLFSSFFQRRPEIHLFAARFKEDHGDIDGARFEYEFLNSNLAPGLLESVVKAANFEHRQVCHG